MTAIYLGNKETERRQNLLLHLKSCGTENYVSFSNIQRQIGAYPNWVALFNDLAFLCNARQICFKVKELQYRYRFCGRQFKSISKTLESEHMTIDDVLSKMESQNQDTGGLDEYFDEVDDERMIQQRLERFQHPFIIHLDREERPCYIHVVPDQII